MSGIYGKFTEHPEFPIEDSCRFTVEILPHTFETDDPRGAPPLDWKPGPFDDPRKPACWRCPFAFSHPVHRAQEVNDG
jgi:hypothetical protein